jgi:hypothetical protein
MPEEKIACNCASTDGMAKAANGDADGTPVEPLVALEEAVDTEAPAPTPAVDAPSI